MKKIFTIVGAMLLASNAMSQEVTFETMTLGSESYDNGSAGNGDFVFDYLTFSNYYDTAWMSWNGFSISNVTDTATAGFGNQYAAYTGSGYAGSENFAVYYPQGTISVGGGGVITGLWLTNTTYAAIAMRDGDAFSKQFGSPLNASGVPDGTNGEDYFRVWIIGQDQSGLNKDSIEFYLADYRFANSAQDYIVDTWEHVDLTNFSFGVASLSFRFESSDMGQWGINTPTYFAVDNVEYSMPLSIAENTSESITIFPNPTLDQLNVKSGQGIISITDLNGRLILQQRHQELTTLNLGELNPGVYLMVLEDNGQKLTSRFVKK